MKEKYYTLREAIKFLKIGEHTLCSWVVADRIMIEKRMDPVTHKERLFVPESSLLMARTVTCQICGKVFKAVHPLKAKFCSVKCRAHEMYRRRKIRLGIGDRKKK